MSRFEIINTEEETDPAGKLFANDRRLMLAVGAREQNAGATSGGANDDPAFWTTIIRQRRNVLSASTRSSASPSTER